MASNKRLTVNSPKPPLVYKGLPSKWRTNFGEQIYCIIFFFSNTRAIISIWLFCSHHCRNIAMHYYFLCPQEAYVLLNIKNESFFLLYVSAMTREGMEQNWYQPASSTGLFWASFSPFSSNLLGPSSSSPTAYSPSHTETDSSGVPLIRTSVRTWVPLHTSDPCLNCFCRAVSTRSHMGRWKAALLAQESLAEPGSFVDTMASLFPKPSHENVNVHNAWRT